MTAHDVHPMAYFEGRYEDDPDPWGLEDRPYEQRKRALTLALLPEARYRRAVEPGCANGALTESLADRADQLVAFDPVPACVDRARRRLGGRPGVQVEVGRLPDTWPDGRGDLVVLSEVAYYLGGEAWQRTAQDIGRWLEPDGTLVAVHYTGATDYPRTAEQVHQALGDLDLLRHRAHLDDQGFIADVWTRR